MMFTVILGEQILRFAISSDISKHKIKTILLEDINKDPKSRRKLKIFLKASTEFKNANELMDS